MATETQTGMDRAEMKRLLLKSKQEPVNCALGVGDDKSVALLTLSRNRSSKSLQGDLQKDFPTAFNTRFGTAVVDTDDDPTLVKFMINKAVGRMARRLVKTLKGTGFRKVQILLEDGSPVETAAEEEASEQAGTGTPGADSATGAPRPSPQAAPQPDAAALAAALAMLVPRIAEVADPTQKEALAKQARVANVNIKTGNLTYAAGGIEQLRRALDASAAPAGSDSGVGQSAPSAPPPPPTSEAPPDAAVQGPGRRAGRQDRGRDGRNRSRHAYRLSPKGVQVALLLLFFHKRLCGPLARSRFHHRPVALHQPHSKLEAAYHRADEAIQQIVDLLAA